MLNTYTEMSNGGNFHNINLKTELILGIFWGHAIKIMATYC